MEPDSQATTHGEERLATKQTRKILAHGFRQVEKLNAMKEKHHVLEEALRLASKPIDAVGHAIVQVDESMERKKCLMKQIKRLGKECIGMDKDTKLLIESISAEACPEGNIDQLLKNVETALECKDGEVQMSISAKTYMEQLDKFLEEINGGLVFAKEVLKNLGTVPLVGVCLAVIAKGLDISLKMKDNRDDCVSLMKSYLDLWKRYMNPLLEHGQSADSDTIKVQIELVLDGYDFCKKLEQKNLVQRFIRGDYDKKKLASLKEKLRDMSIRETLVGLASMKRTL